jgi:hypothetical protein
VSIAQTSTAMIVDGAAAVQYISLNQYRCREFIGDGASWYTCNSLGGTLALSSIGHTTAVVGTLAVAQAVTLSGTMSVAQATTLTGAATLSSTLSVAEAATLSAALKVAQTTTLAGAATLQSTLSVTGAATLSATLSVTQAATLAKKNHHRMAIPWNMFDGAHCLCQRLVGWLGCC